MANKGIGVQEGGRGFSGGVWRRKGKTCEKGNRPGRETGENGWKDSTNKELQVTSWLAGKQVG